MGNQYSLLQNQNLIKQIPLRPSQRESLNGQYPYQIDHNRTALFSGNIFFHRPINYKLAALTFDDAPDSLFAPVVLDVLMNYNVKVTFFSLGSCVHQNSDIIKRIATEGHIIGNHTYDHLDITKIPADQVREQIRNPKKELIRQPSFSHNAETLGSENGIFIVQEPLAAVWVWLRNDAVIMPWFNSPTNFYESLATNFSGRQNMTVSGVLSRWPTRMELRLDFL